MKPLHSLLKRQLKKHFADTEHIPVEFHGCIESVNDAYYQFDADRNMLERSLELSSNEMLQINAEMRESEEKYRSMVETSPDLIFLIERKSGKIMDVNQSVCSLLGYSKDEIIGTTTGDRVVPSQKDAFGDEFKNLLNTGKFYGEFDIRTNDGTMVTVEGRGAAFGDYVYAVGRDITERKLAEQEQEHLNAELSQKNTELERVVYVTSHDLRTPLVNIQGFNKELGMSVNELFSSLQKSGLPEEIKEKIAPIVENDIPDSQSYISRSITKMDSLLTGLLKLSRLGSSELNIVKLDMNRLISDVITILRTQSIKAGAKITVSKLPSCYGDESQISQLFANLAGNAVKFLDPDRPCVINITGYKDNNQSVYCVEDNGIGIEADYQGKIFDIFHRLDPAKSKGEGLGLSIVHRAVERHGGKIWVESEPGKGSRFFISLPDTNKQVSSEAGRQEL